MTDDRRREDRERLEAATRELMDSEGWKRWVETRSRFHHYSFGNTLLIAQQRPEATQVAGYKTWQKLDRQVMKGEKGIRIFAPIGGPCKGCPGEGCSRCGGSGRWQSFRAVSVFDISQTDGAELPAIPYAPVDGDSHAAYLEPLEAFAVSQGLSVAYQETAEGQGGFYRASDRSIVVSVDKSPNGRVACLIHEIAHALGIGYKDYGRKAAEVIVESVAYMVCRGIGLDVSSEALAYVASWGHSDDLDALKTYAQTIDEIARKIETALAPKKESAESEAA